MPSAGEISATGSCARCQRELDLASVKVAGVWYCRMACADGKPPGPEPDVDPTALINRPRRFYGRRSARELKRASP